MNELAITGLVFVLVLAYSILYYVLGRILMLFKSDKLRRIGHWFLAVSLLTGPDTIVKKCPRICNGKCRILNCPLYRQENCVYYEIKARQHLFWLKLMSKEDQKAQHLKQLNERKVCDDE